MVKYYGRARQRIGSVNTNQIGLNMSGCPSKVGRQGYLSRYIARRSQCNLKFCGPVFYHGVPWKWNSGRCVAKAPRGQSFNSGVGHKTTPRFACGNTCSETLDVNIALTKINDYFIKLFGNTGSVVLVGKFETLQNDGVHSSVPTFLEIKHYYPGTEFYKNAPINIKTAIDFVNNLNLSFRINTNKKVEHVIGFLDFTSQNELINLGYGIKLRYNPDSFVIAFGKNNNDISNKSECVADGCSFPKWLDMPSDASGCFATFPSKPLIGTKPISPYLINPLLLDGPSGEKICEQYKTQFNTIPYLLECTQYNIVLARKQQWCVNNLLGFNSGNCWSDCYSIPISCYGYALNMISQKARTYPGTLQNPNWAGPLTASNIHSKLSEDGNQGPLLDPSGTVTPSGEHIAICDPSLNDTYVFALFINSTTNDLYHFVRKDATLEYFSDASGVVGPSLGTFNIWSSKNGRDSPTIVDSDGKIIYSYTDPSNCPLSLPSLLQTKMAEWISKYPDSTVTGWVNIKDAKFVLKGETLVWNSFWKYSPDTIYQGDGNGNYINGTGPPVSPYSSCGKPPPTPLPETSELIL
jgi:hypothetical protein